jgi:endonuclease/exonuclease/phosphatase family metal-dependent hydrolase
MYRSITFLGLVLLAVAAHPQTFADDAPMSEQDAAPLRVMTFNIRYNNPGDGANAWPRRRDWVAEIIRDRRVDVAGMQEARPEQIDDLEERLPEFGWYGVGRDDGRRGGEHTPIFYRKDRLELLDQGSFWLSEQPDEPGSKSWDSSLPRVASWAKLKDRARGRTFFAVNTHFDHRGEEARRESAMLMLRKIPEIAGDAPVMLTGDFNCRPDSAPYALLTGTADDASRAALLDARKISDAPPAGPKSTWNGFNEIVEGNIIDYIFVTPGIRILSHTTIDETRDGRFPSDHLPVLAEVSLK